jgi:phospholipase C
MYLLPLAEPSSMAHQVVCPLQKDSKIQIEIRKRRFAKCTGSIHEDGMEDNFDDNPLSWFQQYQTASSNSPLASQGTAFLGLSSFYSAAAAGTLPEVSYIVGSAELSEHPPYQPKRWCLAPETNC